MNFKRDIKIWLVLDSRGFGGIESHVEQLALGLKNAHADVTVVFLNQYGPHPLHRRLVYSNLNCQILDGRISSFWERIKNEKPDIIHTHGYKAGIISRPLARFMNIACVSTYHSGEEKKGVLRLYDFIDRYTAFLAKHVYAVSASILKALPTSSASLSNNFIEKTQHHPTKGEQIAFVGRLCKEKAPERFILLARHFPHLDFHFYGDGPKRAELEKKAPNNVLFHGSQEDMKNIWPKIGLLVIPSRAEGLPMAALEAMGHGICLAAFNIGALNSLIEHGENGWILPEGDMQGLVQIVREWRESDTCRRNRLGANAIKTIEARYCAKKILPKWLQEYASFTQ